MPCVYPEEAVHAAALKLLETQAADGHSRARERHLERKVRKASGLRGIAEPGSRGVPRLAVVAVASLLSSIVPSSHPALGLTDQRLQNKNGVTGKAGPTRVTEYAALPLGLHAGEPDTEGAAGTFRVRLDANGKVTVDVLTNGGAEKPESTAILSR